MFKDIFRKPKYVTIQSVPVQKRSPSDAYSGEPIIGKKELPDGLWVKCPECGEVLFNKNLEENARICTKCEHHFRISVRSRLASLVDENSFEEWDTEILSLDPLEFPGYKGKLQRAKEK